jgi:hypothetical protein
MLHVFGKRKLHADIWWVNLKARKHLKDQG